MSKLLEPLNDTELDKLLSAATPAPVFPGFEAGLRARMALTQPQAGLDNVVPFRRMGATAQPRSLAGRRMGIAAALGASLVVGVLLGHNFELNALMDSVAGTNTSGQVAEFAPAGFDDLGKADGEAQS
jgi:hypothetical protein